MNTKLVGAVTIAAALGSTVAGAQQTAPQNPTVHYNFRMQAPLPTYGRVPTPDRAPAQQYAPSPSYHRPGPDVYRGPGSSDSQRGPFYTPSAGGARQPQSYPSYPGYSRDRTLTQPGYQGYSGARVREITPYGGTSVYGGVMRPSTGDRPNGLERLPAGVTTDDQIARLYRLNGNPLPPVASTPQQGQFDYQPTPNRVHGGHGVITYSGGAVYRPQQYYYSTYPQNYGYAPNWYYSHYYPTYSSGLSIFSPYYYYGYNDGYCPPYIGNNYVQFGAPSTIYVPVPVYVNGEYRGYQREDQYDNRNYRRDDADDYYLNERRSGVLTTRSEVRREDPALLNAIDDIEQGWREGDASRIAGHIRRDARVAVTLKGKYQYSLEGPDYLDMTVDALKTTRTQLFEISGAKREGAGTYSLTGRHVYRNRDNQDRTVYVSYVLRRMDGEYIITQVGTAPDRTE